MAASTFMGSPSWLRIRLLPSGSPRLGRRALSSRVSAAAADAGGPVRVRFAPSPTGNLHVGGARTALFNYLFARSRGGKFVLRVEDTDLERSTKKSEEAVLSDLAWLGLDWDEGPDIGGEFGPYRQSERNLLYKQHAEKLMESGAVYRCFCSSEELEKMKETSNRMKLPPVYMGKWATASDAEVQQELEKGTPYTYRFRVPKEGFLKINDLIRGEVSWNLNTLGDFVIMRSNGQPVYNFCVTVDDATMRISHVIRAEEHLPNTLRQALIYKALGFAMPLFAHVSLILAPDKSKLSKRHGATSVGQYKEMGYLPQAMVNYLALLGWGDGTENEFFTIDDLVEKFTINRVNKSGAVFDATKLKWMNGQHLRSLPSDLLIKDFEDRWRNTGILLESESDFAKEAAELLKEGIDLVTDADAALCNLLSYPLQDTLSSDEAKPVVEDKLSEVASALISAYDSGELGQALAEGDDGWKKWVKSFGKTHKRKVSCRCFLARPLLLRRRRRRHHRTRENLSAAAAASCAAPKPLTAMASSLLSDCSSCATSRLLPLRRALHPPPPRFRPSPAKAPSTPRYLLTSAAPLPLLPRARRMAALSAAAASSADPAAALADGSARIIDGKLVAKQIRDEVGVEIARMKEATGVVPGLAVILVGSRKDSQTYVRNKKKACEAVGIKSYEVNLPEDCSEYEVIKNIATFNDDPSVHGILVQLPLPRHMNDENILNAVSIEKDVDGFHPLNIGRLAMQGRDPFFVPCTPKGCMELLHRSGVEIKGKRAVVIGRSNIVGMPAALLLQKANATVSIVHSQTKNPEEITRQADIIIAAVGVANLVRGSWIKPGAAIIDVGINPVDDPASPRGYRLVGDVCYEEASKVAGAITPVPGGVGPMTIAMLLSNTLESAKRIHNFK